MKRRDTDGYRSIVTGDRDRAVSFGLREMFIVESHRLFSLMIRLPALVSIALAVSTPSAEAAKVSIEISSKSAYVGMPITMQIRVEDASQTTQPEIPEVDGLTIESAGRPQVSSQVIMFNGRTQTNRSSVLHVYRVTADRPGDFVIPPVKVTGGGVSTITEAVRFTAKRSENGGELIVEIVGEQNKVFVGQSLNVTLKIWVRPYHDEQYDLTLGEREMWQSISQQTKWGPFEKTMQELEKKRQRPGGRTVLRPGADGEDQQYYLYEIDATIYPTRPGQIEADDLSVIIKYPVQIGRQRDPLASMFEDMESRFGNGALGDSFFRGFSSGLTVLSVRPIVAEATAQSIEVMPIPTENRPESYWGAVGRYSIDAEASPNDAKVDDPITITLTIDGTGPMDLVRATRSISSVRSD